MHWGKTYVSSEQIKAFLEMMDLSSGDALYSKCKNLCEWYEEAILNKNFYFSQFINNELSQSSQEHLIIILGACKSLTTLEALTNNFDKINRIIEIDTSGMDEKKELYDKHFPAFSEKIKCITADLSSETILTFMNNLLHEYYNDTPSIIILENFTHFISEEGLSHIVNSFKSTNHNNTIITDYLLPFEEVSEHNRSIPQNIFEIILKETNRDALTTYSRSGIAKIFESAGGIFIENNSMKNIEKKRLGLNKYFKEDKDSWVDCSVWKL